MHAMTFPEEFRDVQACYPIYFCKDPQEDSFYPVALFGFEHNENLFLADEKWNARYIPMMIRRNPFLIGFQKDSDYKEGKKPVISIDMDSSRVNEQEGQKLFDNQGNITDYLQKTMSLLENIHRGHEHNKGLSDILIVNDLLEAFTLEVTLSDSNTNTLSGFYTIDEKKLYELSSEILGELNRHGYLQPIFMAVASQSRVSALLDKKNQRIIS